MQWKVYFDPGILDGRRETIITLDDLGYTEEEWNTLNSEEREKVLDEYVQDWVSSFCNFGWTEIGE